MGSQSRANSAATVPVLRDFLDRCVFSLCIFCKSDNKSVEDDDILISDNILRNLGCIEVDVYRVQRIGSEQQAFKPAGVTSIGAVNERSKKAGAHCVS